MVNGKTWILHDKPIKLKIKDNPGIVLPMFDPYKEKGPLISQKPLFYS
jgi:hypothetical protein